MNRILLVEDDPSIITSLTAFLKTEGYIVEWASGQEAALRMIAAAEYDLALLDVSLNDGNGYAVCSAIKAHSDTPVIFVTASGDEYSVVTGLDMGADDYISKPFRPRELLSRIKSVLRRSGKKQDVTELGSISIDIGRATVTKNGNEIILSALEYRLLLLFCNNKGNVLTRAKILQDLWDVAGDYVNDNTLTVYIKRLREKVEDDPSEPTLIKTIRGIGYRADDK
ncbi:MAG TPA: response regulator transcription factor [Bacillota bacterium]|nr:response regulator transcription factor [Bacillota bacterium]HPE38211.1 response regulator transcription factor [Bacillota bacterium]